jgi:hypothetical protein
MLDQTMLGTTFIGLGSGTLANQVPQGFVLNVWHPDRRELSALVGLGELLGVAAVPCPGSEYARDLRRWPR